MIGRELASRPSVAVLLPPIAWSLYFVLLYGYAAVVCEHAAADGRPVGMAVFYAAMGALTLVSLLPMLWTGRAALDRLRQGDGRFLARVGAIMAALFIAATLFLAAPIALLDLPCR